MGSGGGVLSRKTSPWIQKIHMPWQDAWRWRRNSMCKCPGDGGGEGNVLEDPTGDQGEKLEETWGDKPVGVRESGETSELYELRNGETKLRIEKTKWKLRWHNYWNHVIVSLMQGPEVGDGSRGGETRLFPLIIDQQSLIPLLQHFHCHFFH